VRLSSLRCDAPLMIHEIPFDRATIHGYFSCDLPAVVEIGAGDTVVFRTIDAGWGVERDPAVVVERKRLEHEDLDRGHPLVGPIAVRGARAGQTLAVRVDALEVGSYGFTAAGGSSSRLNRRLGVEEGDGVYVEWRIADGLARSDVRGLAIRTAPFLGVMGMPPPEPGIHATAPPRRWGGNLDCKELVAGSTLYLPIPLDGALFSAGDGHAAQGDGEVSQLAIEAPFDRVQLTINVRGDLPLEMPLAQTPAGWVALGVDEDLDEAAALAVDGILAVMEREVRLTRREALALASVVVDVRVTQLVNGVVGCHAVLPRDAFVSL
jgi:acetamidase/formamidase